MRLQGQSGQMVCQDSTRFRQNRSGARYALVEGKVIISKNKICHISDFGISRQDKREEHPIEWHGLGTKKIFF